METRCTEQLRTAEEELSGRQEEVKRALTAVQNQTSLDRTVLDQQQAELQDHVETSQQLVHGFLQEELQHDVPTGKRCNLRARLCVPASFSPVHATNQFLCCLQVRPLSVGSLCIRGSW